MGMSVIHLAVFQLFFAVHIPYIINGHSKLVYTLN